MLTIAITDSRGRNLDAWVENEEILISAHSGAKLMDTALEALHIIPRFNPDVIVLIAGINDITVMNRQTRRVRLISNSRSTIINHLITQINRAKSLILATHPNVLVAVGGIIGIEMNTYNRRNGTSYFQPIIEDVINAINCYIRQMNLDSNLPHPRLTSKVHTWRRGVRRSIYNRLYDGLHPGAVVLEAWARQLNIFHDLCKPIIAMSVCICTPFCETEYYNHATSIDTCCTDVMLGNFLLFTLLRCLILYYYSRKITWFDGSFSFFGCIRRLRCDTMVTATIAWYFMIEGKSLYIRVSPNVSNAYIYLGTQVLSVTLKQNRNQLYLFLLICYGKDPCQFFRRD